MPNWITFDDMSSQIGYSGSWSVEKGSTRQWEGGVHSTTEPGASCGLSFRGVGIVFRATVPSGSGNQVFDYRIDSRPSVRISTPQQSVNDYDVELIRVEDLPDDIHSIILTNVGGAPFQVDMFKYWPGKSGASSPDLPPPSLPQPQPQPQPQPEPVPEPQPQPQPQPSPTPTSNAPQSQSQQQSESTSLGSSEDLTPNANANIGDLHSSSSRSLTGSSSSEPRTMVTTDSAGHLITKFAPTVSERTITSTGANGQVATVTIIEAAPPGKPLPIGAIIGIGVGGAVAALALLILLLVCRRRRRASAAWNAREAQYQAGLTAPGGLQAATHPSSNMISPFTEAAPANTRPLFIPSIWRKSQLSPSTTANMTSTASLIGASASTTTRSRLSYTGENLAAASEEPPPAYTPPLSRPLRMDPANAASGSRKQET
ncbi:hypothetical protein BKA70DRAFT_1279717 [Coprinopsis sp. MPI-PUGE-AT-0042]|nr:hypothetical protein BKA70DRAFT_1279717 [Coprinopsis sp. MPI-PUGE-AT-0042]